MIIYSRLIPFKGFIAMAVWPFIFVRSEYRDDVREDTINHERIHHAQQRELLVLFFYLAYVGEWIVNLFRYGTKDDAAYRNISFEKEAYAHERDADYLASRRQCFAQWRRRTRNTNV